MTSEAGGLEHFRPARKRLWIAIPEGFGMNGMVRKYWAALMLLLFGAVLVTASPAGRVALLQYINGSVSIQPRGTGDWVAAVSNQPLTIADNVWTDKSSRAELNVGTGMVRMNSETSLTIVNVDRRTVQMRIHQGTLHVHVHHLFAGEIYEVDSSNGSFTLTKAGNYRIDVDPKADTTTITTWKGEGSITGERPAVRVRSHEQVRLSGVMAAYERHNAPSPDGFDEWCRVRNQRQDSAFTARYPSGVIVYGRRW
jgi:hypothetical protein